MPFFFGKALVQIFIVSHAHNWSFLFLVSTNLLPLPAKPTVLTVKHCSKNYLADLAPLLYFHVLCTPHLPLSSPNASNKLCTLLYPLPSKHTPVRQYFLAADQECERWLSTAGALQYCSFLFYHVPFANEKFPVKKICKVTSSLCLRLADALPCT